MFATSIKEHHLLQKLQLISISVVHISLLAYFPKSRNHAGSVRVRATVAG